MIFKNAARFLMLCMLSSVHGSMHDDSEGVADYSAHLLVEIKTPSRSLMHQLLSQEGLDEWSIDASGKSAIFRLPRSNLSALKRQLRGTSARLRIKHSNVQRLIDEERVSTMQKSDDQDWFSYYHPLDEITGFFDQLVGEEPELVRKVPKIGQSYEGRPIFAIHMTAQKKDKDAFEDEESGLSESDETPSVIPSRLGATTGSRPSCRPRAPNKIWVQCLIHAREWISGSTCQFLAQELVAGYRRGDAQYKELLDRNEIIMVPVVNPDGYDHTWKRDRLWRKNRHPFRFGTGVDLNRNFADEHWCRTGASTVPFADTYCGPSAGSEPETQAVQSYYKRYKGRVAAAIDFHSFSQLILRPLGHTEEPSMDEAHLLKASQAMAAAIKGVHGQVYAPKRAAELYPTTGSATDYYYSLPDQAFRPYSVALELRPSAINTVDGFLLDARQIRPCVEEVLEGFMVFVKYALANPLKAESDDE